MSEKVPKKNLRPLYMQSSFKTLAKLVVPTKIKQRGDSGETQLPFQEDEPEVDPGSL